jgi:hypothetical protein
MKNGRIPSEHKSAETVSFAVGDVDARIVKVDVVVRNIWLLRHRLRAIKIRDTGE